MATKNQPDLTFHPFYERARALLGSLGDFAMHPQAQSELAMRVAQQLFLEHANAGRPNSPLDPNNRPGVTPDALPASAQPAPQPQGALTQTAPEPAPTPQNTF